LLEIVQALQSGHNGKRNSGKIRASDRGPDFSTRKNLCAPRRGAPPRFGAARMLRNIRHVFQNCEAYAWVIFVRVDVRIVLHDYFYQAYANQY